MGESIILKNKPFKEIEANPLIIMESISGLFIREDYNETSSVAILLDRKTALQMANWILDNISEVEMSE